MEKDRRLLLSSWVSWYRDPILIVTLALVFGLDQVTKALVRHGLVEGEYYIREGPFRIVHTVNTGSAFGLFPNQTLFLIVASIVGIAILMLVYRNQLFPGFPLRLSLGLQAGGALGNLLDRLRLGEVTDFVELGFWPVFNLADAAIVVGIIIIVWLFLFVGKNVNRPQTAADGLSSEDPGYTFPWDVGHLDVEETLAQSLPVPDPDPGPCLVCGSDMDGVPGERICPICDAREAEWDQP